MISRLLASIRLLGLVIAGLAATSASAQETLSHVVSISWKIVEAPESPLSQDIAKNKPLRIAKAHAQGLVTIEQPAVRGQGYSTIPAGTLFAQGAKGPKVICEPGRRPGQDTITCLADKDADGRYDHFGRVQTKSIGLTSTTTIGFLVGTNAVQRWVPLGSVVSTAPVAEVPLAAEIKFELTLTSVKGGWVGRGTLFNLCAVRYEGKNMWGAAINVPFCTDELVFPDGQGRQPLGFMPSGSLTLVALGKSSASVVLDPPKVGSVF